MAPKRWQAAFVVLATIAACTSPPVEGPLATELPHDSFGTYADPAEEFSFGWISFQDPAAGPLVIDEVRLDEDQGVQLLDSWVTPSSPVPYGIADAPGFPPAGWENVQFTPAIGASVPSYDGTPATDIDLVLHLKVGEGLGTYSFYGITVAYHDSNGRYEFTYPTGWRACVPREAWSFCGGPHAASPAESELPSSER